MRIIKVVGSSASGYQFVIHEPTLKVKWMHIQKMVNHDVNFFSNTLSSRDHDHRPLFTRTGLLLNLWRGKISYPPHNYENCWWFITSGKHKLIFCTLKLCNFKFSRISLCFVMVLVTFWMNFWIKERWEIFGEEIECFWYKLNQIIFKWMALSTVLFNVHKPSCFRAFEVQLNDTGKNVFWWQICWIE